MVMPDTITLAVTVRCARCGTTACGSYDEAYTRFLQHSRVFPAHTVVLEAVRTE